MTAWGFVFACSSKSSGGSAGPGDGGSSSGASSSGSFPPNSTEYTAPDGEVSPLESPGTCSGTTGGAVQGPQDDHCVAPDGGEIMQVTTDQGCTADAGSGDDGGDDSGDPCPTDMNAYGPAMYNTTGSDDDCKFDVSWQSTPICENQPVYFTVVVTKREDGSPLLGVTTGGSFVPANPRPDVVLACTHSIPNTPRPRNPSPSVAPGTYVVGPIVFDQPGDWVFRFHFNEECLDLAHDSPHGHAAFHINVP
ncbi:MAG TPA: hypothetical protein VIY73_19440 [Polyangiaceae bacterium]